MGLEVTIVLVGKRGSRRRLELLVVLLHELVVDLALRRRERRRSGELEGGVADQLASEPQEGLLEVVVRLGRNLKVLQVLLAVESHSTRLHFPLLHVNLVTTQHNRDVLAHTLEITVPVGHVLVCDTRGHIKHDDTALALDVVAIAQTTELLLAGRVPHVEHNRAKVGVELQRVHLDTQGGNVLLLKLTRQVTLVRVSNALSESYTPSRTWSYQYHRHRL